MNDPAFLMYSKDWLTGTAEMLPEEKGVYIDLLCYQHQNKNLPTEPERLARLVGLNVIEFNKIWETLKPHFIKDNERLVNRKLTQVMTERADKGHRNKIIGTFASVLRVADLNKKQYQQIRSFFKVDDWLLIDTERLTERLTEWLQERLKSIGDANGDANGDIDKDVASFINRFHDYMCKYYPDYMKGTELNLKGSADAIRLLQEIDKFTFKEIENVMFFAVKDKFWSANIKSIASLRNKGKNGETKFVNIRTSYLKSKADAE